MISINELSQIKGIGAKTIQLVREYLYKRDFAQIQKPDVETLLPNNIYLGDCLELMWGIPDGSVDMILADLPYGIVTNTEWDKSTIPLQPLWYQYHRVIKQGGAIVLTSAQPFTTKLIQSNIENYRYEWIWDKHIPRGAFLAKRRPMVRHENVLVFGDASVYNPQKVKRDKPVTIKDYSKGNNAYNPNYKPSNETFTYDYRNPDTIIEGLWEANAGKLHPTQKPVSLFEYLIKTYSNEGDLILDNVAGSFTTAIAAINTKRNYICIEKSPEYFELGQQRINLMVDPLC